MSISVATAWRGVIKFVSIGLSDVCMVIISVINVWLKSDWLIFDILLKQYLLGFYILNIVQWKWIYTLIITRLWVV